MYPAVVSNSCRTSTNEGRCALLGGRTDVPSTHRLLEGQPTGCGNPSVPDHRPFHDAGSLHVFDWGFGNTFLPSTHTEAILPEFGPLKRTSASLTKTCLSMGHQVVRTPYTLLPVDLVKVSPRTSSGLRWSVSRDFNIDSTSRLCARPGER